MWHPDMTTLDLSWSEVFFNGFTAIPELKEIPSTTEPNKFKLFSCDGLKFLKTLRYAHRDHRIAVQLAISRGRPLVVKIFKSTTEEEARAQFERLPVPGYTWQQVRQDMDPFILEQRAYERIGQLCSEAERAFFPKYYGSTDIKGMEQALVLEYLQSSLRSRCLFSNSVPAHLKADLQLLRDDLDAFETGKQDNDIKRRVSFKKMWCQSLPASEKEEEKRGAKRTLSPFERRWCETLFIDRLKRLTALHSIGVTHGDIKEDHFRLSEEDFHDTVIFDFSLAYTFTPQKPYMVSANVICSRPAHRKSTFRSMQELVQMERNLVRNLVLASTLEEEGSVDVGLRSNEVKQSQLILTADNVPGLQVSPLLDQQSVFDLDIRELVGFLKQCQSMSPNPWQLPAMVSARAFGPLSPRPKNCESAEQVLVQ